MSLPSPTPSEPLLSSAPTRPTLTIPLTRSMTTDSTRTTGRISRSPSTMARPALSPMGPRTRFASRAATPLNESSDTSSPRDSFGESAPVYPGSPTQDSPPKSLAHLSPIVESLPPPSPKPVTTPPPPAIKIIPKPAVLAPAPAISFDTVPVEFKSLPLEAFLWTLDNTELQQMVSRAIRQSARESFIRLISLENLDNAVPAEVQRLSTLKSVTQSRYRFLVQRRTMLLQALNSSSSSSEARLQEDGTSVVSTLAQQLSETCAECDQLLEVLVRVTDQLGQIAKLLDGHWASALAIALRKLNKSYGKRTTELIAAKGKVEQLEGELEEAWKEATRYAQEMDEVEAAGGDSDSSDEEEDETGLVIIEKVERIAVPPLRRASTIPDLFLRSRSCTPKMEYIIPSSTTSEVPLSPIPRLPSTVPADPIQTLPTDVSPAPSSPPQLQQDFDDTASMKSARSTKSTKSFRSVRGRNGSSTPDASRMSQVFAAKTRSQRASKSSLRIPSKPKAPIHPPVPDLPFEYAFSGLPQMLSPTSPPASSSSRGRPGSSRANSLFSPLSFSSARSRFRRMSSFDALTPKTPGSDWSTMDDIHVRPHTPVSSAKSVVKEVKKRILPTRPEPPKRPPPPVPTSGIPTMWLATDEFTTKPELTDIDPDPVLPPSSPPIRTPSRSQPPSKPSSQISECTTPISSPISTRSYTFRRPATSAGVSEPSPISPRRPRTQEHNHDGSLSFTRQLGPTPTLTNATYQKLKGLSKRYSMPFPLFKSISSGGMSVRSLPERKKDYSS